MDDKKEKIKNIIKEILDKENGKLINIGRKTSLYDGDISLDSLDVATLSVQLEEEFGEDPYTEAQKNNRNFPETIGDILDFYEN